MDKDSAKKLVRETLQNSFDKERFTYFIKNLLNHIEEAPFNYYGQYIPDSFKPYISSYDRIGKYSDGNNRADILIIHLNRETSIERARTMQRNFVAGYLEGKYGSSASKDAALVAFLSPSQDDWRFSFVKMEYKLAETLKGIKAKEEFTPARRYSFLVGKNETTHTAQSRLAPILLDDEHNPTLKQLEDVFGIEKVTKEFFEKYRELFLKLKESLDELVKRDKDIKTDFEAKKVETIDFAKKLLGQIVFLYFLQKKGWFGVKRGQPWGSGSKQFLRELFEKRHGDYKNFFNEILEPLFYEALRLERPGDYYSRFDCRIPFLNGGLFDPINDYDWVDTDILLPNELFSNTEKTKQGDTGIGILDVFDRYNFTVKEDEPLEKEVAIDPEMLGKVFENLLEVKDRKSKGTYYTPREIVHYMCQQSLINYLDTAVNAEKKPIVPEKPKQDKFFGESEPQQMSLCGVVIPREDITSLILHGQSALEHDRTVEAKGKETKTYSYRMPQSIRENAAAMDKALESIRICDPAVGSGAFLVGMMHEIVNARQVLSTYLNGYKSRTPYGFKRDAIQNCLYGVDIDPGAVEIAKLRLWLSLVVDEEDIKRIKPLPNLDYKIVCGNSLLGVQRTLENWREFAELERLKPLYFNETNTGKKQSYKNLIDQTIAKLTNGHTDFDFEIHFSEVFHEKGGFDVVIANPPYVKEYVNRAAFDGLRNSPYYQGKMDLWYLFACRGIDVSRNDSGVVTFIAQNNWVTNHGASKMRNKVITDAQILSLIDFGDFKIFEAGIQTMVMMFRKNTGVNSYSFDYRRIHGNGLELKDIISLLNKEDNVKAEYLNPTITRSNFIDRTLTFSSSDIEPILEKISSKANLHLDPKKEVAQGIVCPQDYVNKSSQEVLGSNFRVGEGIFVLSDNELKALKLSKKELSLLKPFYTTDELKRWWGDAKNKKWIIYTNSSFKNKKQIEEYPAIKEHLDRFKKVITSDNKPYGLHRARDEYFFKDGKVLAVRKCARPTFTCTDFDSYVTATFYVIKTERINQKYLTGLLNSQLIAFWLKHRGKMQGTNFQIDKEPIVALPILKPDQNSQDVIANIVTEIINILKSEGNNKKQAEVRDYEKQIDQMVYKLYGLTDEEIVTIKGQDRT